MSRTDGVFIAFSTGPAETAPDIGCDAGGPYARAIASELVRSGQDSYSLFMNVKEIVFGNTDQRQHPWEINGFVHRIYLAGKPNEATKPRDVSPRIIQDGSISFGRPPP
jgi:hypothetical protein